MNQQNLSSFIWSVADLSARRLQAIRVRPSHSAVYGAATTGLRAGTDQSRRAEGEGKTRAAGLNPEPFLLKKSELLFYNTSPLDMKKLMGDQDNIAENLFSYVAGLLAGGPRHLRVLRFPCPGRAAGQSQPAVSGHREVRQHRPASRSRQQRADGARSSRN